MEKAVQYLKGVGPVRARQLSRLGILTCQDLVTHYPREYSRRQRLPVAELAAHAGETVIISGKILGEPQELRRRVQILNLWVGDGSGSVRCTWFNQGFLKDRLHRGGQISLAGKFLPKYGGAFTVEEYSLDAALPLIQPHYSLTEGISNQTLAKIVKEALKNCPIHEPFPTGFREKYGLLPLEDTIRALHCPNSDESLSSALYTGKFTELFLYQLSFLAWRRVKEQRLGTALKSVPGLQRRLESLFGFTFYPGQVAAMEEIESDLKQNVPMNRLLQGDVGSGKTAVAAFALLLTALNGYKAVLMAPTEIVAIQHYHWLEEVGEQLGTPVFLLTGSANRSQRELVQNAMGGDSPAVLIGTHAVFQPDVKIRGLALVVTDEQHRFGVFQRMALSDKGLNPHVLAMSATPIPRTLALTLYGDMDVSTIVHKPPGRKEIITKIVPVNQRPKVFAFVAKELAKGNSGYIICPLIEESEEIDALSLQAYEQILSAGLPGYSYGVLHGRMTGKEKEEIIAALQTGEIQFLLATTVVEVGVDLAKATFIVIENSERYGLAQLHQLRGRVGRRSSQSFCFLMTDGFNSERLKILGQTNDGFAIAEADLRIRGSGQFLGQRQHGLNEFKLANIITDNEVAKTTRAAAAEVLPQLTAPDWARVRGIIKSNIARLKS